MSRWTVTRLALPGLLAATFAAPAHAVEVAPMPRVATSSAPRTFKIEFEFKLSSDETVAPSAAKPRAFNTVKVAPPCCAFDCCGTTLAVAPMPRAVTPVGQGFRVNMGSLGPTPLAIDSVVPLNTGPYDHKQIINISVGVFGGTGDELPVAPMPRTVPSRVPPVYGAFEHGQLLQLSFDVFATEDALTPPPIPMLPPAIQRCEGVVIQTAVPPCCETATAPRCTAKTTDMRVMYPLVGVTNVRRDESGTWWAEVNGVPQPKQAAPTAFTAPPCGISRAMQAPSQPALLLPVTMPACQPAKPANVPTVEFDVMAGVLGKMLDAPQACPVQPARLSVPVPPTPATPPVPCTLPTAIKPGVTGTWVREIGPIVYVVKVAPDHVTVTATTSVELLEGRTYTEGIVMTADYHMTRDGTTLVGLITSVDAVIEGTAPPDMEGPGNGDELSRIQKLLVDKPLAMNVRLYGDVMVIGNVRLPELEGSRAACYPLTVLGGRYTQLGDKPLPKPKVVKLCVPRDILPTPLTGTPSPYIPSPGIVPTGGTLPPLPTDVPNHLPMTPPRTLPPGLSGPGGYGTQYGR